MIFSWFFCSEVFIPLFPIMFISGSIDDLTLLSFVLRCNIFQLLIFQFAVSSAFWTSCWISLVNSLIQLFYFLTPGFYFGSFRNNFMSLVILSFFMYHLFNFSLCCPLFNIFKNIILKHFSSKHNACVSSKTDYSDFLFLWWVTCFCDLKLKIGHLKKHPLLPVL